MFFVVSLMVVAGLCADSAIAQQDVTVQEPRTKTAKSGEVLTSVRVKYEVQQRITGGNIIIIGLPADWEHAYGSGFGDLTTSMAPTNGDFTSRPSPLPTGQTAATTSYVTVDTPYTKAVAADLTAALQGNTVTVTVEDSDTDTEITMVPGNKIYVTFHKVKVKDLVETDFPTLTPPKPGNRDPVDVNVSVSDTQGTVTINRVPNPDEYRYDPTTAEDYNPMTVIKVSPPTLSGITVVDKTADSGEVRDVTVDYRVRAAMIDNGNVITIGLPIGWEPAYGGGFGDLDVSTAPKNGDFTSLPSPLPTGQTEATTSYVTVDTPYRTAVIEALTASLSGNAVTVSVLNADADTDITMKGGNRITVTFHQVKVGHLVEGDFPPAKPSSRDAVDVSLTVTDSILRSGYEEAGVTKSHYAKDLVMKVSPPKTSGIVVAPMDVKAEEMHETVTVTYTVRDMLYAEGLDPSNVITISLPEGWTHAKANDEFIDSSFLIDLSASPRVSK